MIRFSLIALSVLLSAQAQAAMRSYEASAQSSHWTLVENSRLQCQLNHEVPYYGEAIFRAHASKNKALNFNLDMVVRPNNYDLAALEAVPPSWRPGTHAKALASMELLRQFDGELGDSTAWEMLSELEKGNHPTFYYQDWRNTRDQVSVGLSSVNFKQAYWAFLQCRDGLLPFSFEDIAFTVMNYKKNSSELTKSSKKRLAQIGEYLKHDKEIESVMISAYTDSYGGRWNNLELSKRRAAAIAEYIKELGVDEGKLVTTGFGEKRHVAPNETVIGRGKNRRVVIQIAKP
ncbi:OmpA family protein [Pseudoalteromonas sp. CNC9-20]|uniref:flagellar protein MotY n=1 Tax=Pseudoalteromonas TaxID=53246 RepID=UPI001EF43E98|nr:MULTISPECIES: OmpA family protein [Pseudoalteromonas]MCG7571256.1 OmpA family protein [Pseudoalteromonas sp. CNC9-20]